MRLCRVFYAAACGQLQTLDYYLAVLGLTIWRRWDEGNLVLLGQVHGMCMLFVGVILDLFRSLQVYQGRRPPQRGPQDIDDMLS